MSALPPPNSLSAFSVAAQAQFTPVGLMQDEGGNILFLLQHALHREGNGRSHTETGMSVLSLQQMEIIGQGFRVQFKSEKEIFSASEEAIARQKSLGYVCYQMLRRLQRIEHEGLDKKGDVDYSAPLAIEHIAEMARLKIENSVRDNGFFSHGHYAHVRASTVPVASLYDVGNYTQQLKPAP